MIGNEVAKALTKVGAQAVGNVAKTAIRHSWKERFEFIKYVFENPDLIEVKLYFEGESLIIKITRKKHVS